MGSASAAHENRERVGARTTGRAARGRWGRAARWAGWRAARRAPSRGSAPLPRAGRAASGAARVGGKAGRACKHQGQPRWLDRFLRLDFLLSPRRPRQRHRTDTEAHTRTLAMLGGPGEPSLIVTVRHRATTGAASRAARRPPCAAVHRNPLHLHRRCERASSTCGRDGSCMYKGPTPLS